MTAQLAGKGIGLRAPSPRTPPRRLHVVGICDLGPHLRRIRLGGDLSDFPEGAEGSHIKVFLRRPQQTVLTLPTLSSSGVVWPPEPLRPLARTFSVSGFDARHRELSIDFVLHGDEGPATRWAARAQIGDELGVAGPGGPNPLLGPAAFSLLVGDLTALPAIAALLQAMPASTRGQVLLEVPSAEDILPLRRPEGVLVSWLCRPLHTRSALPMRVRALSLDAVQTFAFVAGESSAVVAIRDHLLKERGFDKRQLYATPYWRERQTEEEYHQERHRIMDELAAPRVEAP